MKTYLRIIGVLCTLSLLMQCGWINQDKVADAVARVDKKFLLKEDINNLISEETTLADSTIIINSFINNWAKQLLLMDGAHVNLPIKKQQEFEQLIAQYKMELYTNAYLDALVKKNIDTLVHDRELNEIYTKNRESFKLNESLLKLQYITLPITFDNTEEIKEKFKSQKEEDMVYLDSISFHFSNSFFNDSVWLRKKEVSEKLKFVNQQDVNKLLKKSDFFELKDSLNLYLVRIKDVRLQNDYAPKEYVMPSLKQIAINLRKIELKKELEKELLNEAIKKGKFEKY